MSRQIKFKRQSVSAISLATLLLVAMTGNSVKGLEIIVPAYFYPTPGGEWDDLNAAASIVPITAIMNPNSGPGTSAIIDYTNAVNSLRTSGGTVIGYVSSIYATRPISDVKADIDKYADWYNIDGIFIDEMTNNSAGSNLDFYEEIYDYVKSIDSSWEVMGNPGTNTQESYLTRPTADRLMVFESHGSNYLGHTPSSWNNNYDSSSFVNLLHTLDPNDVPTMEQYIDLAVSRNVGSVYFTDDVLDNPWDRLPTFWDEQVAKVAAINSFTPGAQETLSNPLYDGTITIDNSRSDWATVASFSPDVDDSPLPGPELDYTAISVANDSQNLYFRFETDESANGPLPLGSRHNVYLDVDQDRLTGYVGVGSFLSLGADYLIQGGSLYSFQGGSQETFSWNFIANLTTDESSTDDIELAVSLAQLGNPEEFDFLLNAANSSVEDYLPNSAADGVVMGGFYRYEIGEAVTIVGDYDSNGVVDGDDYLAWVNAYGQAGGAADGNGDGVVNAADYTVWRDAYSSTSLALVTSVPEPGMLPMSFVLLLVALTFPTVRSKTRMNAYATPCIH